MTSTQREKFYIIYFCNGAPDTTDIIQATYPGIDTPYDVAERELRAIDPAWDRVDLYRVPVSLYDVLPYEVSIEECGQCIISVERKNLKEEKTQEETDNWRTIVSG